MGSKGRFYGHMTSLNPEVTGSLHFATVNYPDGRQTNFIVDCGLYQERAYNVLNHKKFPFKEENVDFALITHNHADHMGRLPYLVAGGFKGPIYASSETVRLMDISLADSFRIEKEDSQNCNRAPMYDGIDFENTLNQRVSCEFGETVYVDRNIKVTFFMNGHLLGAAMILVQISYPGEKDINLLFTGDYKPQNVFFHVEELPEWVRELPLTIVTESTYGYMDTTEVSYHMEDDLEKAIQEGKTVMITVFAQERAQMIMDMLKNMQKLGKINTKIPIRLDGNLAQEYTRAYKNSKFLIESGKDDFFPENFSFISKENRLEVLGDRRQQIVLTTSGMADHGPAKIYLEHWVGRKDVLIYIPGYTSPDTLGYQLQHPVDERILKAEFKGVKLTPEQKLQISESEVLNPKVFIFGRWLDMRAQVLTTSECSSHGKADEIIAFLQGFKHLNLVLINHGQTEVKQQFAERVGVETNAKYVGILGAHTFKISCYGYVKHMGAKLVFPDMESPKLVKAKRKEEKKNAKKHKRFKLPFVRKNYRR